MLCACFEGFVNILFPYWNNIESMSLSYEYNTIIPFILDYEENIIL